MSPFLSALLGVQSQAPVSVEDEEIMIDGYSPKVRDGLVRKGTFRRGGTGGNILGLLGDAFLTQAGEAPRYAPRVQQDREAEAIRPIMTEPEEAIRRLFQVNTEAGGRLWERYSQNQARQASVDQAAKAAADKRAQQVEQRTLSLLGAATPQSYPAIVKMAKDYADRVGVALPFDLPDTYDEASIQALRMSGIAPDDQERIENQRNYQEASLGNQRMAEGGRMRRASMSEGGRMSRFQRAEAAKESRFTRAEQGKDRRSASGRKRSRPALSYDPKTGQLVRAPQ